MVRLDDLPGGIKLAVVGVSGGPDSLCLLDLLHRAGKSGLIVAHFNHRLRPEADAEVEIVRHIAREWGLPFATGSADVRLFADRHAMSLEEAARHLRYQFLFRVARRRSADAVLVAHTADDQAETVLMHLLRGAGLDGLRGMQSGVILSGFDPTIPVYRPLLSTWRYEIEQYCQDHNLSPVQDQTNTDHAYFRNRLRHALIPELEKYNPNIKAILAHTARALQGDSELLSEYLAEKWQAFLRDSGMGWLALDYAALAAASPALRRNIFRHAFQQLQPGLRDIDFAALERAASLVAGDYPGGLRIVMEAGRVYVVAPSADLPVDFWPRVTRSRNIRQKSVALPDGWTLEMETVDRQGDAWKDRVDPWSAWLDADSIQGGLTLRARQPGDRFAPLGMDGRTIKIQDFFVNAKIPGRARATWPLVCTRDRVVWIPGYALAEDFRVTAGTHRLVHLTLRKQ